MSTTTQAPKQIDPAASLHAEALGLAKNHGRLMGRRIIVVGAGQRKIIDVASFAFEKARILDASHRGTEITRCHRQLRPGTPRPATARAASIMA